LFKYILSHASRTPVVDTVSRVIIVIAVIVFAFEINESKLAKKNSSE
jgi:hypothetical protein